MGRTRAGNSWRIDNGLAVSLMFMSQPEADRLVQAAAAELANGRISQAIRLLETAVGIDPCHLMALTKLAEVALVQKDHARALGLTDTVLEREPNFAPAWHQRASALWSAGRQAAAVSAAEQAVAIQPPNPDFRLRFAQFAAWTGFDERAQRALAPLLAAEQQDTVHYAAAVSMLGELEIAHGRFRAARRHLDRALRLQPGMNTTRVLRGMNRLRLGQFGDGWIDYCARESMPGHHLQLSPAPADEAWQGQPLTAKTLLVTDDQGHGDAIQFFRYLPLLQDRGAAHITWRTFPPLVRLLHEAAPEATVLSALPTGARFDFHCSSTSLPRWLATNLNNIPARVPYLRASPQPNATARMRASKRLNVGLAWSGDARHGRDCVRSIPADLFLRLADVAGISFHSLQHEVRTSDLPACDARPAINRMVEAAANFADTAALIAQLDLVITVDTGVAHLAGALGKPVWIVLHVAPDWRWMTDRADSPWYPTARLFRVTPAEWLGCSDGKHALPSDKICSHAALTGARPHVQRHEPTADTPELLHKDAGWGPVLSRVEAALRALVNG